jgi:hypothetical protein
VDQPHDLEILWQASGSSTIPAVKNVLHHRHHHLLSRGGWLVVWAS